MTMLKSYFLTALRSLVRERAYVLINVLGLALSLACSLVLVAYVRAELSYDQHYEDADRIGRVVSKFNMGGDAVDSAQTSDAVGPLFARSFPDSGEFVRFQTRPRSILRHGETALFWEDTYFVDDNVFRVFSHRAVYGDLKNSLEDPSSIAISQSMARRYFGDRNPVGETLGTDNFQYRVSAVFADVPENSHLRFNALLSRKRLAAMGVDEASFVPGRLIDNSVFTYFKVSEAGQLPQLEKALNAYFATVAADVFRLTGSSVRYQVQPLADVHFDASWDFDLPTANVFQLYGFSAIAIFVLLVACINYANLATARATKRAREIGMRKVLGVGNGHLITQFLGEALAYTLTALLLGLVLVEAAERFTPLATLFGKSELIDFAGDPGLLAMLVAGAVLIAGTAAAYPAFYLSSISPLAALTASRRGRISRFSVRQVLVFVQLLVSVFVVSCTILMALQMRFIAGKPLGFETENRLAFRLRGEETLQRLPVIRGELLSNANVLGVAESSFVPGNEVDIRLMDVETNEGQMEQGSVWHVEVSPEFVEVMGLKLMAGRNLGREFAADIGTAVLVNESLVKRMGWQQPLGKRLNRRNGEPDFRVVGVVNDFHLASLRQKVEPMLMLLFDPARYAAIPVERRPVQSRPVIVKIGDQDIRGTLAHIEAVARRANPRHPFEFAFFEDRLNRLYASETNLLRLIAILAAACIFISCMGLFGLSAYTTELRTREIGVRKVLGASSVQIVLMLGRSQFTAVAAASVLASVASYLVIDNWLASFAYRAPIQYWAFIAAGALVAFVAFVTVSLQGLKIARSNPTSSLRYQ